MPVYLRNKLQKEAGKIIEIHDEEIIFRNLEAKDKIIPIIDIVEISKKE
jgi:hypothetical protein